MSVTGAVVIFGLETKGCLKGAAAKHTNICDFGLHTGEANQVHEKQRNNARKHCWQVRERARQHKALPTSSRWPKTWEMLEVGLQRPANHGENAWALIPRLRSRG